MAERETPLRVLMLFPIAALAGAFWSLLVGVLGGAFFTQAATVITPVLFATALAVWQRVDEKSWIDFVPLGIAVFIYLMLLGELTRICPCGYMIPGTRDQFMVTMARYSMENCSLIAHPLAFVALGAMLLPPYDRKTFAFRFAAFAAAAVPYIALSFMEMSIGYHD